MSIFSFTFRKGFPSDTQHNMSAFFKLPENKKIKDKEFRNKIQIIKNEIKTFRSKDYLWGVQ